MIFPHRVLVATFMLGILCAPMAWSQPATMQAGGLPLALKSAVVVDAGGVGQIKAYIHGEVGKLCAVNNNNLTAAREALIDGARGGTPGFLAKYAEILDAEARPVIQECQDMRGRLNAGIVVARVAELANNTKLEKSVLALLDKNQPEPLKLWGIRAARSVLPELVKVGAEKALLDALVATVKQYPTNGPLVQDAYDALDPSKVLTNPPNLKFVSAVVDPLLDLAAWRISIYKDGVAGSGGKVLIAEDPYADTTPFGHVLNTAVWNVLKKEQQVRSFQLACELLALDAMRGDDPQYRNFRPQLQDAIKQLSGLIFVTANTLKDQNLMRAAKEANTLIQQTNAVFVSVVPPLCEAMSKAKGFEEVKPPKFQGAGGEQGTAASADDAGKSAGK